MVFVVGERDPAAVLARRSEPLFRLFAFYLRWYVSRHFHAVRISRAGLPRIAPGRPLIAYSNHPSWWDPAIYILLSDMLFRDRAGYGPMDSEALGKYGVFERMGVFGVPQDSARGAVTFLRTSLAVLERPASMMFITAEGAFTDPRIRPVTLRPGLAHLARRLPNATILPFALDYTFWNESRPEVLIRFGEPLDSSRDGSVADWTRRLADSLTETMDALAAEAVTRNASLFQPLLRAALALVVCMIRGAGCAQQRAAGGLTPAMRAKFDDHRWRHRPRARRHPVRDDPAQLARLSHARAGRCPTADLSFDTRA